MHQAGRRKALIITSVWGARITTPSRRGKCRHGFCCSEMGTLMGWDTWKFVLFLKVGVFPAGQKKCEENSLPGRSKKYQSKIAWPTCVSLKTTNQNHKMLRQLVPTRLIRYLDVGVEEEKADDHSFELIPLGARFPLLLFHQVCPRPGLGNLQNPLKSKHSSQEYARSPHHAFELGFKQTAPIVPTKWKPRGYAWPKPATK